MGSCFSFDVVSKGRNLDLIYVRLGCRTEKWVITGRRRVKGMNWASNAKCSRLFTGTQITNNTEGSYRFSQTGTRNPRYRKLDERDNMVGLCSPPIQELNKLAGSFLPQ